MAGPLIQLAMRRDLAATWTSEDPILAEGEIGYETDTGWHKIGDGATAWTTLIYYHGPPWWNVLDGGSPGSTYPGSPQNPDYVGVMANVDTSPPSPIGVTKDIAGWSTWKGGYFAVGYKPSIDLVLVSSYRTSPNFDKQILQTDSDLSSPTLCFELGDITGWVAGTFKEIMFIEYAPKIDTWVMACGKLQFFYCTGDPTLAVNWTEATAPPEWSDGVFMNIKMLNWDPGLEFFFLAIDGQNGKAEMIVSIDGINWSLWDDYQVLGGAEPTIMLDYKVFEINGTTWHVGFQQEEYIYKTGNAGAGVLSTACSGWTKTPNNGVMNNTSVTNVVHLVGQGDNVIVNSGTRINISNNPASHTAGWGDQGNSNDGWDHVEMGMTVYNLPMTCLLYIPELDRPWVTSIRAGITGDANSGWFDCAAIDHPGTERLPASAPQWAKMTVEPFKSWNDSYDSNAYYTLWFHPTKTTNQANYRQDRNADMPMGINGWWAIHGTAISHTDDFIIFQKPY